MLALTLTLASNLKPRHGHDAWNAGRQWQTWRLWLWEMVHGLTGGLVQELKVQLMLKQQGQQHMERPLRQLQRGAGHCHRRRCRCCWPC